MITGWTVGIICGCLRRITRSISRFKKAALMSTWRIIHYHINVLIKTSREVENQLLEQRYFCSLFQTTFCAHQRQNWLWTVLLDHAYSLWCWAQHAEAMYWFYHTVSQSYYLSFFFKIWSSSSTALCEILTFSSIAIKVSLATSFFHRLDINRNEICFTASACREVS